MARVSPALVSFSGGELSPKLLARIDTAKYGNGARLVENFIVMPYGGVTKRPGTKFNWYCRTNNENQRLQRFTYGDSQAYMLLFSNLHIRVFTATGIVTHASQVITAVSRTNPAVVAYAGADTYANGDKILITGGDMVELNNREFTVANVDTAANTFELAGINATGYTPYTGGARVAGILEISTTYVSSEIAQLGFTQSANTLFITHRNHPPAQLMRTSDTQWTLSDMSIVRGPWRLLNKDQTIRIKSDAVTGAATLTSVDAGGAPTPLFDADMVGGKFKLYTPSRTSGETEVGGDFQIPDGSYWTYNGNVYRAENKSGDVNSQQITPPTHLTGSLTCYDEHNGGQIDMTFLHQSFGIVDIEGFTSNSVVTGAVYEGYGYNELPLQMTEGSARYKEPTRFWQEGAWSEHRGYPARVTLFEQRLSFGCSTTDQQTVWLSASGAYSDFEEGSKDDNAVNYTIGSDDADVIRWMAGGKSIRIGTTSGIYVLSSTSQQEAVTPTNIKVSRETSWGSSPMEALNIGQAVIFGARDGDVVNPARVIMENAYNFDINGFVSVPLTIWADHITGQGVIRLAYQAQPDSLIWAVRTDGLAAAMTYERSQEVMAWHRHYLGGWSDAPKTVEAQIEDVATMPGPDGDLLFMIVQRSINGQVKRYVETLSHWDYHVNKTDGVFLDCAITYDGPLTTVITGLWHLEGETLQVLADGVKHPDVTVASGQVTLLFAAAVAHFGYKYASRLTTLDLEAGGQAGAAQGKPGRISEVVLRLHRSLGGAIGPDIDRQDAIVYRIPSDAMDTSPALHTGDLRIKLEGGWADRRVITISHEDPFNFTLLGMFPVVNTSG